MDKGNSDPKIQPQVVPGVIYEADFNIKTRAVTLKTIAPGIGVIAANVYPFDLIRDTYYACKKKLGSPAILKPFRGIIKPGE